MNRRISVLATSAFGALTAASMLMSSPAAIAATSAATPSSVSTTSTSINANDFRTTITRTSTSLIATVQLGQNGTFQSNGHGGVVITLGSQHFNIGNSVGSKSPKSAAGSWRIVSPHVAVFTITKAALIAAGPKNHANGYDWNCVMSKTRDGALTAAICGLATPEVWPLEFVLGFMAGDINGILSCWR